MSISRATIHQLPAAGIASLVTQEHGFFQSSDPTSRDYPPAKDLER
jgi:hypothetical protein